MRVRLVFAIAALTVPSAALAAPGENSFTPTSLRVPIQGVFLSGSGGGPVAMLYQCGGPSVPPPPDGGVLEMDGGVADADASLSDGGSVVDAGDAGVGDCMVDMADQAALSALFMGAIEVRPGTYDTINFGHCVPGENRYFSHASGSVELSGVTYYTTRVGGHVLTTDASAIDEVPLEHAGCGSSVALPGPITVTEDQEITISAFFSLRNITWATSTHNGIGGCTNSSVSSESVCTSYPIPVAYLGTDSPALDTYYITEDQSDLAATKAGGQMLILKDAANHPFGGFARRLYSPTSVQPVVSYDTPIKFVGPGPTPESYEIDTWGGGGPGGVAIENYIRFPAFEMMSHDASLVRGDNGGSVPYRAVKQ